MFRLEGNQIGDAGITALARAVEPVSAGDSRTLPKLMELWLQENKVGDDGLSSLSCALGKGALLSLEEFYVNFGPLGTEHPALKAACDARGVVLH